MGMSLHLRVYQLLKKDFTKLTKIMIKGKSNTLKIQDIEGHKLMDTFGGNPSLPETKFLRTVYVGK
jgi:hypothetical protein